MTDAIIVDYSPFSRESVVTVARNGKRETNLILGDLESLPISIVELAYMKNIYNVKFNGPYVIQTTLREDVEREERSKYSQCKINFGGINE